MTKIIRLKDGPAGEPQRIVGEYCSIRDVIVAAALCGSPFVELVEDEQSIGFWPPWGDLIRIAAEKGFAVSPVTMKPEASLDSESDAKPIATIGGLEPIASRNPRNTRRSF